jgi:hypothetical protein
MGLPQGTYTITDVTPSPTLDDDVADTQTYQIVVTELGYTITGSVDGHVTEVVFEQTEGPGAYSGPTGPAGPAGPSINGSGGLTIESLSAPQTASARAQAVFDETPVPISAPPSAAANTAINTPVSAPQAAPVIEPISAQVRTPVNTPANTPIGIPVNIPISAPASVPANPPITAPVNAPAAEAVTVAQQVPYVPIRVSAANTNDGSGVGGVGFHIRGNAQTTAGTQHRVELDIESDENGVIEFDAPANSSGTYSIQPARRIAGINALRGTFTIRTDSEGHVNE